MKFNIFYLQTINSKPVPVNKGQNMAQMRPGTFRPPITQTSADFQTTDSEEETDPVRGTVKRFIFALVLISPISPS